jgi:acetolactate synthase regulatory subunit
MFVLNAVQSAAAAAAAAADFSRLMLNSPETSPLTLTSQASKYQQVITVSICAGIKSRLNTNSI